MKIFFVLFGFIFLAKFISAQSNKKAEEKKILSARTASNLSIAKHDIEGMSKFWLPDFVLIRVNLMISSGKKENINAMKELFKTNPQVSYTRNPSEILISDNDMLAWEKGTWIAIHSYSKGGNYSAVWKKYHGEWKLQVELFVSLH